MGLHDCFVFFALGGNFSPLKARNFIACVHSGGAHLEDKAACVCPAFTPFSISPLHFHTPTHIHTYIYIYMYMYMYLYIYIYIHIIHISDSFSLSLSLYMVIYQIRGPQYRPQNTIILIIGTPKMVPLILGNPPHIHIYIYIYIHMHWVHVHEPVSRHIPTSFGEMHLEGLGFRVFGV